MYQVIWGTAEWNIVMKETIEKSSKEIVAKAETETKIRPPGKGEFPKSVRKRLAEINKAKDEPEEKFLKALTKPYSELEPADRLEIYDSDCMVKR